MGSLEIKFVVEMGSGRRFLGLKFRGLLLSPTKILFIKVTSRFKANGKENGDGLVSLYKDLEAYAEYRDIQVMWDMIQIKSSSSPPKPNKHILNKRPLQWKFFSK